MRPEHDSSLQASSLKRALGEKPPKTLTPYEWLEWYEQHGQPDVHKRSTGQQPRWWQRLLGR